MKSLLFIAMGLLLAAVAVSSSEELVRDQFGVRPKNIPVNMVEDYDPEKELDFVWFNMDRETVENGLREIRDGDVSARADIVVEKPVIVPLGRAQGPSTNDRARSFVFNHMDRHEAKWILYPYNFTYIEPWTPSSSSVAPESSSLSGSSSKPAPFRQGNQTLPDGAMISTMSTEEFPLHTYMNWIESKTDMNLKKAKVVYDMNIAVLQIQAEREADDGTWNSVDITYDSDGFCTAFYSYFYPKYNRCFVGVDAYKAWLEANPTMGDQSCIVYVSPDDIKKGKLKNANGENFFGMLIIPDIMMKEVSYVKKTVSGAKDKVQAFVNDGGVLLTTGKGAYLTETWGFVPSSTFSNQYTMINPKRSWQRTEGCDNVGKESPVDDTEAEFMQTTLCFSLPRQTATAKETYNSILSAPLLNRPEKSHGMTKILFFQNDNNAKVMQHNEMTGLDSNLTYPDGARSYPALMAKSSGKGYVVVNMGNPGFSSSTFQHIYNAFLLGASRPISVDSNLVGGFNRTVPALEQVDLTVSVNVVNYFTADMTNAKLHIFTIKGTEVKAPSKCSLVNASAEGVPAAPEGIQVGSVFACSVDPKQRTNSSYVFSIRIVDVLVTQQKKDVIVLWPHLQYVDPNRASMKVVVSYGVKIQSAMSALLRADMNIDPSSWYPLHASGTYIDNVMNCENKEETYAYHVQHISVVPLVSPLIDILDQVRLAHYMILDKRYYDEDVNNIGNWSFPFPQEGGDNRAFDYLDWDLLIDRSDDLAADWDEGVKLFRESRSKFSKLAPPRGDIPKDHVMNANYQTNNDDDTFLLKQFQFDDSDKFYEHAVQRLMAFLDVTIPEAAKTYWGETIPEEERSASNPEVGKKRILFVRHDIFFGKKYLLPSGLDKSYFDKYLTFDRYYNNTNHRGRTNPGAFGNNVEPDGMIPAEYTSDIQFHRSTKVNVSEIEKLSGGGVKYVHYVVPVDVRDGLRAGDFYQINPDTGYLVNYSEVQFKYMYGLLVDIEPEYSRRGGEMVFTFDENDLPWDDIAKAAAEDKVTISADQIAVYKTYSTAKNELRMRFKRGQMPNEAYGRPSHLQIYFEDTKWLSAGLNSPKRNVRLDVYELHYDLGKPENGYEDWSIRSITNRQVEFTVNGTLKMPALRLQFVINGDLEESFMNPYELREPLVRYSLYEQEILAHRAVYGSAEFHPKSEPSLVTRNGGFSTFTHVGTSSVPFREYVNTETSLQIPAGIETGRVEWDDIWGRHFVQNVRSTIFEYPPIPPPLRNFVMTTTYEILDKQGKRMLGGWRSNEEVDVHVQMKLLNNYPKWFEVTACRDNRVLQDCTVSGKKCGITRIYDTQDNFVFPEGTDDGKLYFKRGQNASYGICFADGEVRLEGQQLTDDQKNGILEMTLCAKKFNSDDHSCEDAHPGLPVLKRVPENSTVTGNQWNFASRVLSYWPDGYIKENMWDLTHYDYDDNQFDKAYKYHMDNNLPHLEHGITRPDNLIAFPLFKGLGYSMVYDKEYTNPRFAKYRGWWSDNLQNKDRTLVAGNEKSNDVSVGKESLIPADKWVDITELHNAESLVKSAEKNVYKCLFNRRSVKNYISNKKVTELFNVYENNIVPVPIDFNDNMEFSFKCDRDVWYDPLNISQYPNTVYTETPRDWLYFGANLRGGALEDINVIYRLNPLESELIKYEGMAKVQDGGRFVYWNPANSKNSYLIVDNPVHVVPAKRNDIEIAQEIIPSYTTTFDSVLYHHFTISDPEEIEREWESPIWTNNNGYGDFTVQVYVGDAGTTALPSPGTKIRVRYTFMNNAGFDINMLKDAINSTAISQESINAYEMMKGIVRTLRRPDAYNFLDIQVPEYLKKYISIGPCPDVVGIAPLFFDFDSINVVTIRDGWKGDYYLDINISSDFPDELRGRLNEIPVKLVKKYFDMLPGVGDVTGVHDYNVEMPSIVFGVPYASNHPLWPDKVFYTSGYATNVDPVTKVAKPYVPQDAILVTDEELELYRACLGRDTNPNQTVTEGEFSCLDKLWEAHLKNHSKCEYSVVTDTSSAKTISFAPCMQKNAPEFPVKVDPVEGPDHAELHILMRTHANQIKSGYPTATYASTCTYKDWMNKSLSSPPLPSQTVHAKGAWISLKWSVSLLSDSGMPLVDPLISPNNSGLAQVTVTLENTGDYYAYNVQFNLTLPEDVRLATEKDTEAVGAPVPEGCGITKVGTSTMFWCDVDTVLVPYTPRSFPFRVFYNSDKRPGAGAGAKSPLNMRIIADKTSASIDLTPSPGEKRVVQDLEGPYGIPYTARIDSNMVVVTGRRTSEYGVVLNAKHKLENITVYIWRAKLPKSSMWTTFAVTNVSYVNEKVSDRFTLLGGKSDDDVAVDYVVAVSRTKLEVNLSNWDTITILTQSNVYEWRETDTNLLLLLLLLPGLAIPAVVAAAIFATTKGSKKEAVKDIGMAPKEKFVPQEIVDEEGIPMQELDTTPPPPTVPQRAEPVVVPPEPAPEVAASGKSYAIPTGPTYLRAGVGVNVVDN